MIYLALYFFVAAIAMFMRGYCAPADSAKTSEVTDWLRFMFWPLSAPSTFLLFGAAVRYGKMK